MSEESYHNREDEEIHSFRAKDGTKYFFGGHTIGIESEFAGQGYWGEFFRPDDPEYSAIAPIGLPIKLDTLTGIQSTLERDIDPSLLNYQELIYTLTNQLEIITLKYNEAIRENEKLKSPTHVVPEFDIKTPTEIVSKSQDILTETNQLLAKKNLENNEKYERLVIKYERLVEEQQRINTETNDRIKSLENEIKYLQDLMQPEPLTDEEKEQILSEFLGEPL